MPHIDSLVSDIYSILEPDNHHEVNEDNVQYTGEVFKDLLRNMLRVKEPGDVLRFSSLGKPDRQLYYEANSKDEREVLRPTTIMKFQFGHIIELLTLFLARESGHEVTHEQAEVVVDGVTGHLDAVIDGVVVDVKSASPYSFKKFKDGSLKEAGNDPFGYVRQISGYAEIVTPDKGAAFLAVDKVGGDITLLKVDSDTVKANDTQARITHLKEVINQPDPPPRCYAPVPEGKSGNQKLNVNCSYCSFKDLCWADANGGRGLRKFLYSSGPIWLTHCEKTPNVFEAID